MTVECTQQGVLQNKWRFRAIAISYWSSWIWLLRSSTKLQQFMQKIPAAQFGCKQLNCNNYWSVEILIGNSTECIKDVNHWLVIKSLTENQWKLPARDRSTLVKITNLDGPTGKKRRIAHLRNAVNQIKLMPPQVFRDSKPLVANGRLDTVAKPDYYCSIDRSDCLSDFKGCLALCCKF